MSKSATGSAMPPVRFAKSVGLCDTSGTGSRMSSPSLMSGAFASSAAGLGSTCAVTGVDMFAVGMPGAPTPKPGMKAENFPAMPPATTILMEAGLLNFGTKLKGKPRQVARVPTDRNTKARSLMKILGKFGAFFLKRAVSTYSKCGNMFLPILFQSASASLAFVSMPAFKKSVVVLRAHHEQALVDERNLRGVGHGHGICQAVEQLARGRFEIHKLHRAAGRREDCDGILAPLQSAVDGGRQGLPHRGTLLPLPEAHAELHRGAQRRGLRARQFGPADILQEQLQRAADTGAAAAAPADAMLVVDLRDLPALSVHDDDRCRPHGGRMHAMQAEVGAQHGLGGSDDDPEHLGGAPGHDRGDRQLFDGDLEVGRRALPEDLPGLQRGPPQHQRHAPASREHHGEAVGEPCAEEVLGRIVRVLYL
mmetsp:Transcript_22000/g.71277  ORF Transcript_22000/g.71277 Transcript_22000/m.71277 type:complete len:422 (+) Transcript_22000:656-1921(+)